MIHELFLYYSNKASNNAKIFGHLKESIALIKRQKRCQEFWKSHQDHCKKFILQSINSILKFDRILIIGSGPLHEIPIEEISKKFKEVILVDVVHLNETKIKYQHLSNLNFIEHDITELENVLIQEKKLINKIPSKFLDEEFDLVISANLLSQLALHFKKFILKNKIEKAEEIIDQFCFNLTKDHFDYLNKFKCTKVLITDIETYLDYPQKKLREIETPYINFSLPKEIDTWIWNIAPIPELSTEFSLQMKVVGIIL